MQISARNQLRGKVQSIKRGAVMAEVVVALDKGGDEVISAVTLGSGVIVALRMRETLAATRGTNG